MERKILSAVCLLFSLFYTNSVFADFEDIPLNLENPAAVDRIAEPVTSGVPLSEEAGIYSVNDLALTDSGGSVVPCQFTVMSRWRGTKDDASKPIKWVLLDFQASVGGSSSATYYLKNQAVGNTGSSSLSIQNNSDYYIINTGKAEYKISKTHFNVFDYVNVDGVNVVSQNADDGVVLIGTDGKRYTASGEAPELIEVEEQGPMRSVIRVRGVLKADDGIYYAPSIRNPQSGDTYTEFTDFDQPYDKSFVYYNARIHFYNNKDFVKLVFTLENNGAQGRQQHEAYYAPIQAAYFDSVDLVLGLASSSQSASSENASSIPLSSGDSFSIYQDWKENLSDDIRGTREPKFSDGIYFETKKNETVLAGGPDQTGQTNPGWLDVDHGAGGVCLAVRQFWQNFPKKLSVDSGKLKIGLWPSEGYYPNCQNDTFSSTEFDMYCKQAGRDAGAYLFDSGRHKSYEILLQFYSGQNAALGKLSQMAENPLIALAPPSWMVETKALGMIAPAGLVTSNPVVDEAIERFEKHHKAMVYETYSEHNDKLTISNVKNEKNHWEYSDQSKLYGWMNFGDLSWGTGQIPSALHYDWTYSMLLHYLRTGQRKFFHAGAEMAKHRYDVDQYHGDRTELDGQGHDKINNHTCFYETSSHSDPTIASYRPARLSPSSHVWNGGMLLYYLITGDRLALEASAENAVMAMNKTGNKAKKQYTCQVDDECPSQYQICDTDNYCIEPAGHETRSDTWPMLMLINMYRVTGEPEHLEAAENIAANRMGVRERIVQQRTPGYAGYFGGGDDSKYIKEIHGQSQSVVMWQYLIEAMVNTHYESQNEELGQLLVRMADFTKDHFWFGGEFSEGSHYNADYYADGTPLIEEKNYLPLQPMWGWRIGDPDGTRTLPPMTGKPVSTIDRYASTRKAFNSSPLSSTFAGDLLAYVYKLTGNPEYLVKARHMFKDALFYHSSSGRKTRPGENGAEYHDGYTNPAGRSSVTFFDSMFPNSHTKVHGWLGRTNQILLHLEDQLLDEELELLTSTLPQGTANAYYEVCLDSKGGQGGYSYSLISGTLPDGLTLTSDGMISGYPAGSGNFSLGIRVTSADGSADQKTVAMPIRYRIVSTQLPEAVYNLDYSVPIELQDAHGEVTYEIIDGELPEGLTLSANTGVISGMPTQAGDNFSFRVQVTDANGMKVSEWIFLQVMEFASFEVSPSSGLAPLNVVITNTSNNADHYEWDLNNDGVVDIQTDSTATINHTYDAAGHYEVSLTAYNTDAGRSDTLVKEVVVNSSVYDPVLKLNFEDQAVSRATDDSNYKQHSPLSGAPAYVSDSKQGSLAMQLSGNGDYLDLDKIVDELNTINSGTVMMWAKPLDNAKASQYIFSAHTNNNEYIYIKSEQGKIEAKFIDYLTFRPEGCQVPDEPCMFTQDEWTHIALVWTHNSMKIYINGVEIGEKIHRFGVPDLIGAAIGTLSTDRANPDYHFNGIVDDVTILDKAISEDNVVNHYNNQAFIKLYADFDYYQPDSGNRLYVQFVNKSACEGCSITSYNWDLEGDGTIDYTSFEPGHTFESYGAKTVFLTVSDGEHVHTRKASFRLDQWDPRLPPPDPNAPQAQFSASPTAGAYPLTVSFSDQSVNAVSWEWDFDNDGTVDSTEQNPSYTYDQVGTYNVSLRVRNAEGSIDTELKQNYIRVIDPDAPLADFSATPTSGEAPLEVQFTNLSNDKAISFQWDFDNDGTVDSTERNPSYTYGEGVYSVTLRVRNSEAVEDVKTLSSYITVSAPTIAPVEETVLIRANCQGEDNCFTSLSGFQAGYTQKNLVSAYKKLLVEVYNDWPQGLQDAVSLEGWTTDEKCHIHIYAPKTQRHTGAFKDAGGNYTGSAIVQNDDADLFAIRANYTTIEGLIFDFKDKDNAVSLGAYSESEEQTGKYCSFAGNIVANGQHRLLTMGSFQSGTVYNNILINENENRASGYGAISVGASGSSSRFHKVYNNTIYLAGNFTGIKAKGSDGETTEVVNNICYKKPIGSDWRENYCYQDMSAHFSNNISSDNTGNIVVADLADFGFKSAPFDLRLLETSAANDAGMDMSAVFTEDIEGDQRAVPWDIGADQYDDGSCMDTNWIYADSECQPDNTFTRTWTKTGECEGGVTHPNTEQVACEPDDPGPGPEDGPGNGDNSSGGESGGGCFVFSIQR